jgi:hypothetical protein
VPDHPRVSFFGLSPALKDSQGKSVFDWAKSSWIRNMLSENAAELAEAAAPAEMKKLESPLACYCSGGGGLSHVRALPFIIAGSCDPKNIQPSAAARIKLSANCASAMQASKAGRDVSSNSTRTPPWLCSPVWERGAQGTTYLYRSARRNILASVRSGGRPTTHRLISANPFGFTAVGRGSTMIHRH